MKKILEKLMCPLLLVSISACSGQSASENTETESAGDQSSVQNTEKTEAAESSSTSDSESEKSESDQVKTLVAYFSATNNTEEVAEYIADETGADLFELIPVEPYSSEDLSWTNEQSRVSLEHEDQTLQNSIELEEAIPENWDEYETIFIGFPIWWGSAAWPVNDFIQSNDFTGKIVVPFCTSSSSGHGQSASLLAAAAGTGNWLDDQRFSSGASEESVREWVTGLEL